MADHDMLYRFAGVTSQADQSVVDLCYQSAIQWFANAGVPYREDDRLYDMWVYNLASWLYDNRGAGGDDANIPAYIVASVHQLRPTKGGS